MHAAKCMEIFGYACPIYIRAIASESNEGQGPLHANTYHSIFSHMPGMTVICPMTPKEFRLVWRNFLLSTGPFLVSEHRSSYKINYEINDITDKKNKTTIVAISSARLEAVKAINELKKNKNNINLINLIWIKPLKLTKTQIQCLKNSKKVLIKKYGCKTDILGLKDVSPGVAKRYENGTPSAKQILKKLKSI
jgi:pyruvate/2-oxoglutarate/acetoin dehydrogenase E1 component